MMEASHAKEAVLKALYGRLFDWLVQRLNQSIARGEGQSAGFIGVLDIFGFESFQNNSFEQVTLRTAPQQPTYLAPFSL